MDNIDRLSLERKVAELQHALAVSVGCMQAAESLSSLPTLPQDPGANVRQIQAVLRAGISYISPHTDKKEKR